LTEQLQNWLCTHVEVIAQLLYQISKEMGRNECHHNS